MKIVTTRVASMSGKRAAQAVAAVKRLRSIRSGLSLAVGWSQSIHSGEPRASG